MDKDIRADFGTVFDADNHYWEGHDAFTRYRAAKYQDRGLRLVEVDGAVRYFIGDREHPILPGPGDLHGRPVPGSLFDYFAGKASFDPLMPELWSEKPVDHPEWFNRDARLACMDDQGIEAAWMFPSHGVCIEGPMQPDIEASLHILGAFNRWIDDEWGFAYKNRIFGVPLLSLSSLDGALKELEWALSRGARIITLRNGPAFTPDGMRSPADPRFDPFWARVEEAGITVTVHAGFEDGYRHVDRSVASTWGINLDEQSGDLIGRHDKGYDSKLVYMLQKHRLVRDFAAVLVSHGLFERFPRLKFAYIENGGTWVGPMLHDLQVIHTQNPGMFGENPVDQFHRNCWVAPFVEDDVDDLARHMPVERILFGSDWPHAEGVGHPREFFNSLLNFSGADQRRIMLDNARELTFAA
ncbi:amidohydrolase family protein [Sphingomonas solaris]|uniref:Amidohydrolase family protein n=1 Tax=Alterirhizorhabdus solaris TaxID=2529389 RepID=A0A558QV00_9SPHN|nr:amidohydrolase family protein [Sphingomonas solaris]TVV70954.1 amidohydrolase family protein [Sphingomonas solaris]